MLVLDSAIPCAYGGRMLTLFPFFVGSGWRQAFLGRAASAHPRSALLSLRDWVTGTRVCETAAEGGHTAAAGVKDFVVLEDRVGAIQNLDVGPDVPVDAAALHTAPRAPAEHNAGLLAAVDGALPDRGHPLQMGNEYGCGRAYLQYNLQQTSSTSNQGWVGLQLGGGGGWGLIQPSG